MQRRHQDREKRETVKIKNRLEIDFDALPDEVVSKLAHKIEKFINDNCPEVVLHGSCSMLDEDSLVHETAYRASERVESALRPTIPTPVTDFIMSGGIVFLDEFEPMTKEDALKFSRGPYNTPECGE